MHTEDFLGSMVEMGSKIVRHDGSKQSALNIISGLLERTSQVTLDIQKQSFNQGHHLLRTSAYFQQRQEWRKAERDGKLLDPRKEIEPMVQRRVQSWPKLKLQLEIGRSWS